MVLPSQWTLLAFVESQSMGVMRRIDEGRLMSQVHLEFKSPFTSYCATQLETNLETMESAPPPPPSTPTYTPNLLPTVYCVLPIRMYPPPNPQPPPPPPPPPSTQSTCAQNLEIEGRLKFVKRLKNRA